MTICTGDIDTRRGGPAEMDRGRDHVVPVAEVVSRRGRAEKKPPG